MPMRGPLLIVLFGVLLWGCARPQPPVLEFDDMTLYFGSRSADLVSSEREKIIRLASILGAGHEVTVTIAGFAGAPGDSADRMNRLALARTLAVRDALVADLKESRARRIRVAYRACGIGDGAPPVHRVDIHVADGMTGAADLCDDHDPTSGGGVTTIAQPI